MKFKYSALFLPFLFLACADQDKGNSTSSTIAEDIIPIRTSSIQTKTTVIPISATGILGSSSEQRLSFKIGGVIKKVYVDEGDLVRAGQLLATMDKTEIDAQVNQAQEGLSKAARDLSRAEGLYRDSSATLELLQNTTTARDVAKEAVRIATFNQRFAEIRATKAGKVIKKLINEGEITGPGLPCFVLFGTGPNDWIVRINVSDRDWARLVLGMPAKVYFDAYEGTVFNGKVTDLAAAADPSSGLYTVELRIATQGKRLAPGLFAKVDIRPSKSRPYTVVPIEAIVEGDGKTAYVFALQPGGNFVKKMPVQIAFLEGSNVLIASGLEGVSEVVTAGAPYLTEKKQVRKVE